MKLSTKILSAVTSVAIVASLSSAWQPASAAPTPQPAAQVAQRAATARPHVAPAADASLSDLQFANATLGALDPAFVPSTHDYQILVDDDQSATVTPTTTNSSATVAVTDGGVAATVTSGTATLPLVRGRNDVAVTVTSADHSATSTYRITMWRLAAPKPTIVSLTDSTTSVFGGTRMTVELANGGLPNAPCYRNYFVGDQYTYVPTPVFDPVTGLTRAVVTIPERSGRQPGPADLHISTSCLLPSGTAYVKSDVVDDNAVTYVAGLQVTSIDAPATVTTGTPMTVFGPYVSEYSDGREWLTNSAGDIEQLDDWDFTGNGQVVIYSDYSYGNAFDATSGPRTVHYGYCPENQRSIDANCTSTFSKTINWVAPVPTDVSFTPSSGPQSGGTTIRLRGRFIVSGNDNLHILVGGQEVTSYSTINEADESEGTFAQYTQGYDIVDVTVPASAVTGPVPVTVTSDYGTTVARGTFTYSARPVISGISPTSVANSGGSVVTLSGTSFGTSGQPTVIIGGVRSPSVVRVNSTTILATVPALSGTGPVDVTVASPQGGGISAAASLTLTAPTTAPTVTKISPASGHAGDDVTITGTGFGPAGTAGVTIDGVAATVTSSTASTIAFSVPNTNTPGAKDVVVSTVTNSLTKAHAFTVLPDPAITTVTPTTIPSYAVGTGAKITLDGYGFGAKGTVKVGSAVAVAYTATAGGTHIVNVEVPTTAAGPQSIVLTPAGSTTPLRATVNVTAPALTYVGPNPHDVRYDAADLDTGDSGFILGVPTTGNVPMRLEGTGFGTGGVVKVGSTVVTTTSWTDTAITFAAPAHAVGPLAISVTPTHSTLGATRAVGVRYVTPAPAMPTISTIVSNTDYSRGGRNEIDPVNDSTNDFTLTGTNLAGTSAATTRVVVHDGSTTFTVVPTQVTQNSLQFDAPRNVTSSGWKDVEVDTNVATIDINFGLYYINAGTTITASPVFGLCQRADVTATGSVLYHPATTTITASSPAFGTSGTVTIDGVAFTTTSYSSTSVSLNMANLASNLTNPWGAKSIVITPDDTSLPAQSIGFTCQVTPTVNTTINSSTSAATVAAGTTYTPGFSTTGFVGTNPFTATAPTGYEWVTAGDFGTSAFSSNVHNGLPAAAGDYYVRVSLPHATYNHAPYPGDLAASAVHLTITGTPVTITPVSNNGSTVIYKGQLGDGTGSSSTDFHYTATTTTDPITAVTWQYRDSICDTGNANAAWTDGLPSAVARSSTVCGGNGTTQSSWDVRVKSFEMTTSGTDRSLYYAGTFPSTQVTITPRDLTVSSVRADKVWDGTTTATLGDLQVTGAVTGDDVQLANGAGGATFANAAPGVNKVVTLSSDLTLAGAAAGNYHLTNPQPTVVGTISKASAVLALSSSASSLLISQNTTATITPQVTDSRGGAVPDGAGLAAVQLVSQTPSVCSVSGTTVTPLAAGTCTIAGSQAASTNYNASTAASDPSSLTETLDIQVFAAPQAITVVADDLRIAVGDDLAPTSQIGGLFDGDSVSGVDYDYYQGSTLLTNPPTAVGTYRVVTHGGTLTAADPSVYSNPSGFTYVPSTLVITALPPSITTISPASGPTTGGTVVTITGTDLDTVRSVTIGAVTLRVGSFTVNGDGTTLRFTTPAVRNPGPVTLTLTASGGASSSDVFTYTGTAPGAPTQVVRTGPALVTFMPPASTGGSPITGYQVSTDNGLTWHTVPTTAGAQGTRIADLTGLAGSAGAQVRVRAINANGTGPASVADKANAPTRVSPVPADRRATVAFLPPSVPGGLITSYQASLDGGRTWRTVTTRTATGGRRTFTISGLRNGVTYHVVVRAVTASGVGAASTAHSVIPNSAPLGNRPPRVASQIAVPKHPAAYHGKRRTTTASATSHNGTWAHRISSLGTRQLTKGEAATLDRRSLFRFDSAVLTKVGKADVKALAGHLRLAKAVTCEGYTDYAGKRGHELSLSRRRAIAVCQALRHYGAHVVTTTHGYGGDRPVVVGGTAESRDANRRVVVLVTK